MNKRYEDSTLRVRISKNELRLLEHEREDIKLIKKWIELGRKDQGFEDTLTHVEKKIDDLEDKIERLVKMLGLYAHHNFMSTQLLKLPKNMDQKQKEDYEHDRILTSHKIRHSFFPEFRIPSFEKDLDQWLGVHKKDSKGC